MTSPDWFTLSTIASTVALVMSGFLWLASRIFRLGHTSHRLDAIEPDVAELKTELSQGLDRLNQRIDTLSQRLDTLIFTLAGPKPDR